MATAQFNDKRLPPRFWAKVHINDATGCWEWCGPFRRGGYGKIRLAGKEQTSHRVSYEALCAPIPTGLQMDHLCRVRCCVNPAHLEPVTQLENIRRGVRGGRSSAGTYAPRQLKTHCIHGHPFSPENTKWIISETEHKRRCKICERASKRRYREAKRNSLSSKGTL